MYTPLLKKGLYSSTHSFLPRKINRNQKRGTYLILLAWWCCYSMHTVQNLNFAIQWQRQFCNENILAAISLCRAIPQGHWGGGGWPRAAGWAPALAPALTYRWPAEGPQLWAEALCCGPCVQHAGPPQPALGTALLAYPHLKTSLHSVFHEKTPMWC